ncbi:hypothetical protein [Lacticaseibacillus zhaodongensis]|uniref:hypothetical protein n=1 Tax=Lacticaseibacillus zhaodongensis TaxID=2668065 RepID=UPI0012D2B147|nr:hypothetical protein [Lacticaseibacillus zhaodongensis]
MFRYHFLRDNIQSEQAFLQRQAQQGYQLRRFRGGRYDFRQRPHAVNQPEQVALIITTTPLRSKRPGQRVTTVRLSRNLYYNALYAPAAQQLAVNSDSVALAAFHRYMLEHGSRQQWKGGIAIFAGIFLLTLQAGVTQATGLPSSWPLRIPLILTGAAAVLAGSWGLMIGLRNTLAAVHAKQPRVVVKE